MKNTARRHRGGRNYAISALAAASLLASTSAQAQSFGFATFSAFILSDGTLVRSSGVAASTRTGTGRYEVTFTRAVDKCVAVASVMGVFPGYATPFFKGGTTTTIGVRTFNSAGVLTDSRTNLIVSCGP